MTDRLDDDATQRIWGRSSSGRARFDGGARVRKMTVNFLVKVNRLP
jgi:hypothetical protein